MMKFFFWVTDLGFLAYWLLAAFANLPPEYLFKDYDNPLMVAWNWSFLPLDLLISATGLSCLWYGKRNTSRSENLAIISLTLTACSGLQAVSFWAIRSDYSLSWWAMNLYLLIYPLFFLAPRLRKRKVTP